MNEDAVIRIFGDDVDAVIHALEHRCLFRNIGGRRWACQLAEDCWYLWRLADPERRETRLSLDFSTCTCGAEMPCVHARSLRWKS